MQKIYFRADASVDIGYGHFIRTLALADMLKDDFDCTFFTVSPTSYQKEELKKVCKFRSLNIETHFTDFVSLLEGNEIVVLDNYYYSTAYQKLIKNKGCRLVCIDDIHDKHYVADVVINHALGALAIDYSVEDYTQLCLGLSYAMLRLPFFQKKIRERHATGIHLTICFGGADINNITGKILDVVAEMEGIARINVIIGDAYSHKQEVEAYYNNKDIVKFYSAISAEQMASLLNETDIAVLPASSVLWEALFMKVSVVYGYYVDNQMDICAHLGDMPTLGLTCVGDWRKLNKEDLRAILLHKMQEIPSKTDFNSIQPNVKYTMIQLFSTDITIRLCKKTDMMLYYEWANDPIVRNSAFHTEPILLNDHEKWFYNKLKSDSKLYICYYREKPIGQVRFDRIEDKFEIDISIDRLYRGQGFGSKMLIASMRYCYNMTGVSTFMSSVKEENIASIKLFTKAGFSLIKREFGVFYFSFLFNE